MSALLRQCLYVVRYVGNDFELLSHRCVYWHRSKEMQAYTSGDKKRKQEDKWEDGQDSSHAWSSWRDPAAQPQLGDSREVRCCTRSSAEAEEIEADARHS